MDRKSTQSSNKVFKTKFFLPKFHGDYGHKFLAYQGSRLWNEIPNDLKNQSHLENFHFTELFIYFTYKIFMS